MTPKPDLPIYLLLRQRYVETYGRNLSRMAAACDATPTMIKKWIAEDPQERTTPSPGSCMKIAKGFHLDSDDVLTMAGYREGSTGAADIDPRLASFLAELESGWRAMDDAARDMAERTARALFHVPPVQRHVTKQPKDLGRPKMDSIAPNNNVKQRRLREPRGLSYQKNSWGFQPA